MLKQLNQPGPIWPKLTKDVNLAKLYPKMSGTIVRMIIEKSYVSFVQVGRGWFNHSSAQSEARNVFSPFRN